jgi:ribosomal-protein-alanine N-acetyltransferase
MSELGIRVRTAAVSDVATVMAFAARAATAANWSERQYASTLADHKHHLSLVIEDQGEVVGLVVAHMLEQEWEIQNIAVTGGARRRGLATRLMGELMERARAAGAERIFLEVRESNHAARALYEKWAFEPSGRRKAYYKDPQEDALVYRFSFPQGQQK